MSVFKLFVDTFVSFQKREVTLLRQALFTMLHCGIIWGIFKKHHSNILIYRPQISFFPSLSLLKRFPALSFLYDFHCLI